MSFSFNIKEQIIIGIAALALIIVVFTVFVFKPQYDRYSNARSLQEQELKNQQSKQAELDGLRAAKKEAAMTEAKSLSLSKRMPEETDLASILVELDELGNENNVKVLDISPSAPLPAKGYAMIPISIKVVANYFNITDFLYNLVKMKREYTVGNVEMEIAEAGYPLLTASINLSTFVYTPAEAGSTGNAKAAPAAPTGAEAQ